MLDITSADSTLPMPEMLSASMALAADSARTMLWYSPMRPFRPSASMVSEWNNAAMNASESTNERRASIDSIPNAHHHPAPHYRFAPEPAFRGLERENHVITQQHALQMDAVP